MMTTTGRIDKERKPAMIPDARQVHIYLGDLGPETEVHLHFAPGATPPGANGDSPQAVMLRRMKAYANADNIQAVYDGLTTLGLVPHTAKVRDPSHTPQAYLRWTEGDPGRTVLYLNTASVAIVANHDKVSRLPGARIRRDAAFFAITTPTEITQALAAVKAALT
jgi:hypothetical protein